jgi:hypothetical protein
MTWEPQWEPEKPELPASVLRTIRIKIILAFAALFIFLMVLILAWRSDQQSTHDSDQWCQSPTGMSKPCNGFQ